MDVQERLAHRDNLIKENQEKLKGATGRKKRNLQRFNKRLKREKKLIKKESEGK